MDVRYEPYILADPLFYDTPERWRTRDGHFAEARLRPPPDWHALERGRWLVWVPPHNTMPLQGWKIHASARPGNAEEILAIVQGYCTSRDIPFKFLRSKNMVVAGSTKYAARDTSGKFITIYPADERELHSTLEDLDNLLSGFEGPRILTDLRWRQGPLYVRYGGFAERYCEDQTGQSVLAIEQPDGKLVPDDRRPVFSTPDWVTVPDFLTEDIKRHSEAVWDHPYQPERPLHFSNAGGLYEACDMRTGQRVVLKEARPFAGLDAEGHDAVTRLRRERNVLESLRALEVVPELIDHVSAGEHEFLVMEHIEGTPLNQLISLRNPLVAPQPSEEEFRSYADWAIDVLGRVEDVLLRIHQRGIVYGDLHWGNILVRDDGRVMFIDFEEAFGVAEDRRPSLGDPGFASHRNLRGFDIDKYALARLQISTFFPTSTAFAGFTGSRERHNLALARAVEQRFPVPEGFVATLTERLQATQSWGSTHGSVASWRVIEDLDRGSLPGWEALLDRLAHGIRESATPERPDRLFPGDIAQFGSHPASFVNGASGVLYALAQSGYAPEEQHTEWLLRAARQRSETHAGGGFSNGWHGIAYALERLGFLEDATDALERAMAEDVIERRRDLHAGLAGAGLNQLHFAHVINDSALLAQALRTADRLTARLAELPSREQVAGPHAPAGLMFGDSGPALFLLRLFESTRDRGLLELATSALERDLACCVTSSDGTLVDEGWRRVPYLGTGSAGIGLVLAELSEHLEPETYRQTLQSIRLATWSEFVSFPGLMNGRAGLMAALQRLRHVPSDRTDVDINAIQQRHLRRLAWQAAPLGEGIAVAGDQLLRLSMDFASGTAGLLLVLSAIRAGRAHVGLPFLSSAPRGDHRAEGASQRGHTTAAPAERDVRNPSRERQLPGV